MFRAIILPLAQEDIYEATRWYESKQNGLGRRFTAEVRKKVRHIRQHPLSYAIRYDNVRTAVVEVFPFMIHYTVDEEQQTILIAAVLHTSRDPEIWTNR